VSVETNPGGLSTTVTYDGSLTPPTNAGSYAVVATVTDPNHTGSASDTFVIFKAPATVTLGNLAATYDGTPKAVSVETSPGGLRVAVTYDGSPTPPTNAGSYVVVAMVTDPNHAGTAIDTLVITEDPVSSWRSAHFNASEMAAGLADDTANPDGDEFNNLTEYVFGTDPRAFTPPLLGLTSGGGQVTLSFVARAATGAWYTGKTRRYDVEWSGNLAAPSGWHGVDGHTGIPGDGNSVQVTLPIDNTRKFFRLNVSLESE
jgi:hypothetical protein